MTHPLPRRRPDNHRRYNALLDLVDRTYGPLSDQRAPGPARYRLWPLTDSAAVVELPGPTAVIDDA
jgi:hypothetical protein